MIANSTAIEEIVAAFKEMNTGIVKGLFAQHHQTFNPMLNVLVYDGKSFNVETTTIDGDLFSSKQSKKYFSQILIPQLLQMIEDKNLIPVCVSLATDAFLRTMKYDQDKPMPTLAEIQKMNISHLEEVEVLMINYETKLSADNYTFEYARHPFRFTGITHNTTTVEGPFSNFFRLAPTLN